MPALAKIQTKKVDIRELIKASHLDENIKEKFLEIIPKLDKSQIKEVYDFVYSKEQEIESLEQKIKEEESKIYEKMLKEVDEYFRSEKKNVRKLEEKNSLDREWKIEEDLLSQLDEL